MIKKKERRRLKRKKEDDLFEIKEKIWEEKNGEKAIDT